MPPTRPIEDTIRPEFLRGTDDNDFDANDVPIDDAGSYFTSTEVEGALQELGAAMGGGGGGGGSAAFRGVVLTFSHSESTVDGVGELVHWDNVTRDTDTLSDLGTDDTIIATFPFAAAISVHAQVTWSAHANGSRYLYVVRNDGSDHFERQAQQNGTNVNDETQDIFESYLEVGIGDTIAIQAYQDSGGSVSYNNGYKGQVTLTVLEEL